jgi:fatty acid elongase 3
MTSFTAVRDATVALCTQVGAPESWFTTFEFVPGQTPLSDFMYPVLTVTVFCFGVPALQSFMKNREVPPLKWLLVLHNMFLFGASAFFAFFLTVQVGAAIEARPDILEEYGFFNRVCSITPLEQRGVFTWIYYCNHLLKYYELIDTLFLVLKKKPVSFLHGYHHPATLVLTYGQITDAIGIQWAVIVLNLYVHTVMYFYYMCSALRIRLPFKQSVTIFQILQFVIDLYVVYTAAVKVILSQACSGSYRAAVHGVFILTSYLFLFVDFYNVTYSKKPKVKAKGD